MQQLIHLRWMKMALPVIIGGKFDSYDWDEVILPILITTIRSHVHGY